MPETTTTECRYDYCHKPAAARGESAHPFCSHDCGISDYYHRKDVEHRAQYEAWLAEDPATRGQFQSTVIFD